MVDSPASCSDSASASASDAWNVSPPESVRTPRRSPASWWSTTKNSPLSCTRSYWPAGQLAQDPRRAVDQQVQRLGQQPALEVVGPQVPGERLGHPGRPVRARPAARAAAGLLAALGQPAQLGLGPLHGHRRASARVVAAGGPSPALGEAAAAIRLVHRVARPPAAPVDRRGRRRPGRRAAGRPARRPSRTGRPGGGQRRPGRRPAGRAGPARPGPRRSPARPAASAPRPRRPRRGPAGRPPGPGAPRAPASSRPRRSAATLVQLARAARPGRATSASWAASSTSRACNWSCSARAAVQDPFQVAGGPRPARSTSPPGGVGGGPGRLAGGLRGGHRRPRRHRRHVVHRLLADRAGRAGGELRRAARRPGRRSAPPAYACRAASSSPAARVGRGPGRRQRRRRPRRGRPRAAVSAPRRACSASPATRSRSACARSSSRERGRVAGGGQLAAHLLLPLLGQPHRRGGVGGGGPGRGDRPGHLGDLAAGGRTRSSSAISASRAASSASAAARGPRARSSSGTPTSTAAASAACRVDPVAAASATAASSAPASPASTWSTAASCASACTARAGGPLLDLLVDAAGRAG